MERTNSLNEQLISRSNSSEDYSVKIHQASSDLSKLKSMIHSLDLQISELEKRNNYLVDE